MHPKALFLYGTNKEDDTPNFGLFTWITNCWNGEYSVMACIGEEKLTKDRIREQKIFSANLVSEALLPLADYLGNTSGYTSGKMDIPIDIGRGMVLDVPVLRESPFVLELEVIQTISLPEHSDIFICKICNTLKADEVADESKSIEDRLRFAAPVVSVGNHYFTLNTVPKGAWGQWKDFCKKER